MRRIAKLLPYLVILLLLAIAAVLFLRGGPFAARLKETVTQELQQRTGRKVVLGKLTLTGPGRVELRDVTISNPDGTPLLSAPDISVTAGHGGVLERMRTLSDIREIVLRRPTVRVVRESTGALDISDLFRRVQGKAKFTGKVVVKDGTLTFVDESRGGQVTELQRLDLTSATDAANQTRFSLSAVGAKCTFADLKAAGEYNASTGLTRISGDISDLDVVFAQARLPRTKSFRVLAGRGDVSGAVTLGPAVKPAGFRADLTLEARNVELAFPWLTRPLLAKSGRFRLNGEQVSLVQVAGTLEGAPVTAHGTVTGFRNTRLDLAFTAAGMRQAQLRALFPHLSLPPTLSLPAPLGLEATARGVVPDIAISGRVNTAEVVLSCVPWHDFTSDFQYARGQVTLTKMRAHGSPRQLEGDLQAVFGPAGKQQTKANLVLREVPLKLLAGCSSELAGLDVSGTATVTIRADLGAVGGISGSLTARDVRYRGYALGNLSGDFTSLGPVVRVTRGRISGPTATGTFSLTKGGAGAYELTADLSSLHLASFGLAAAAGEMRGRLHVSGALKGQGTGRIALTTIGPGPIRSLSADLRITPRGTTLTNLLLQPEHGQITGEVSLTEGARLGGKLLVTGAALQDWVPLQYLALLPAGTIEGAVDLGGSLSAPSWQADLSISGLSLPALGTGSGRLRAHYAAGTLSLEELTFGNQGNRIIVQGEYSPRRGMDFRLAESRTDLAVLSLWTQPRWKVAASGPVTVNATVRGPWRNPEVTFRAVALAATINDQPVQDLTLAGAVRNHVLSLETASLRQGAGRLDLRGSVDLVTKRTNLQLAVSQIDLAVFSFWTRPHLGLAPSGLVTAEASLSGPPQDRTGSFSITSAAATVNDLPLTHLELDGKLSGGVLTLGPVAFQQGSGSFTASGTVDLNSQQVSLAVGLNAMDISPAMLAFAQAASRLSYFKMTDQLLRAYAAIPGPLGGTLTAALQVSGAYRSPRIAADLSLERLSFSGGAIDSVSGSVEVALREGAVCAVKLDLLAGQAEALAQVQGDIVPGGDIKLRVEISYLDLKDLASWIKPLAGVGGRATVSFDVTGQTGRPVIVGSAFLDAPSWGPLKFEAATAYPITLQGDVLKIEDFRVRSGPMQGKGSATIPLRITYRPLRIVPLSPATADLSITGGTWAPIRKMTPMEFNADLHLARGKLIVQKSADESSPDFKVPGLRGTLGKGEFTVSGDATLPETFTLASFAKSRVNLTADLDPVDLVIPAFITAKLRGRLLLRNAADGEPLLETAPGAPLVLSAGNIGVPPSTVSLALTGSLPFAPKLNVRVVAGNDLWFRYKPVEAVLQPGNPAEAKPASYVDFGGALSAPKVTVEGEVQSRKGELTFPNAKLELANGRARLERNPDQPLRVRILEAEATGTVGDYQIVLRPTGQVYPAACYDPQCVPLDFGIRTTPFLDPAFALALLVGPVVAPTVRAGPDALSVLGAAQQPTLGAGALAGFMLPTLGSSVLGLDYAFEGPLSLRVRERLFGHLFATYSSPISGAANTRRLSLNYQVTPRYYIGASIVWSATALPQTLYLINRSWDF